MSQVPRLLVVKKRPAYVSPEEPLSKRHRRRISLGAHRGRRLVKHAVEGNIDGVQRLLARGDLLPDQKAQAFVAACVTGRLDTAQVLLNDNGGVDVNFGFAEALRATCQHADASFKRAVIRFLLKSGVQVYQDICDDAENRGDLIVHQALDEFSSS